ncbi:MAG TPA: Ni/Fe-hydrogenase, b-type cytochrome subunit [Kofleriaceae bacterium]|nr:Ni/Fe-hydrogenase, b-type cytochrome subunit [Kofleriaceae bacterium]
MPAVHIYDEHPPVKLDKRKPVSRPVPARVEGELVPVYVWDVVVRATHWAIVLSMIVLAITGVYLGRPFVSAEGPAREHFVTGYMKIVHAYAAIAFTLAVLSRIVWMFLGPRHSGWRQFIPTSKRRLREMVATFKFYIMLRPNPPQTRGHNPLAGATYVAVFGLYLVMIASGLALYSIGTRSYMHGFQFLLPLFHGAQMARWIHHVTMWLLIGFVVHHLFSALLTSRVERNGTIDSIFSGYKFLPKNLPEDDDKDVD